MSVLSRVLETANQRSVYCTPTNGITTRVYSTTVSVLYEMVHERVEVSTGVSLIAGVKHCKKDILGVFQSYRDGSSMH